MYNPNSCLTMGNLKMKKAQLLKAHKTQPTQSLFQNRKNTRFSPNFIVFFCRTSVDSSASKYYYCIVQIPEYRRPLIEVMDSSDLPRLCHVLKLQLLQFAVHHHGAWTHTCFSRETAARAHHHKHNTLLVFITRICHVFHQVSAGTEFSICVVLT